MVWGIRVVATGKQWAQEESWDEQSRLETTKTEYGYFEKKYASDFYHIQRGY